MLVRNEGCGRSEKVDFARRDAFNLSLSHRSLLESREAMPSVISTSSRRVCVPSLLTDLSAPPLPRPPPFHPSPSSSSSPHLSSLPSSHRHSSSRSSSSSQWLQRQRQDPFVRARASGSLNEPLTPTESFVSRSAFKLVELQSRFRLISRPGMRIVDLGAAPGGWVQAAQMAMKEVVGRQKGKQKGKGGEGVIVGVDLLPLNAEVAKLPGVAYVRGDFLDPRVQAKVVEMLLEMSGDGFGSVGGGGKGGRASSPATKVDLVLSDMLANLSGNSFRDAQLSIDLCEAALSFALDNLAPTSSTKTSSGRSTTPPSLVMKCLQSSLSPSFQDELKRHFTNVRWEKPSSSRPESREGYWVCGGRKGGSGKEEEVKQGVERGVEEDSLYF